MKIPHTIDRRGFCGIARARGAMWRTGRDGMIMERTDGQNLSVKDFGDVPR